MSYWGIRACDAPSVNCLGPRINCVLRFKRRKLSDLVTEAQQEVRRCAHSLLHLWNTWLTFTLSAIKLLSQTTSRANSSPTRVKDRLQFKNNCDSKALTGYTRVYIKSCRHIRCCITTIIWRWAPYKGSINILPRFSLAHAVHVNKGIRKYFISFYYCLPSLPVTEPHIAALWWATTGPRMRQRMAIKQSPKPEMGKWTQTENELRREEGSNVN